VFPQYHAADKLIRPAIRKHFVNNQRFHLESLRLPAAVKVNPQQCRRSTGAAAAGFQVEPLVVYKVLRMAGRINLSAAWILWEHRSPL